MSNIAIGSDLTKMYLTVEMLKKSGQIQEDVAAKLLKQTENQIKVNITEQLTNNTIDIKA